ncbi:putative casein kinase [Corchorus capsularis]|uniref:Putative casein kinase n=1 Tax=Corchorus capsularis TaxID=210143 RepID=A0A1R3GF68_COCAP|nr:putative casein kinase [Corchorus capsularis]
MEKWEKNFYISSIAGATNGSSLVVMSKGTPYTQQSYKVKIGLRVLTRPDAAKLPTIY